MSRIRTIKPDFFLNEEVAELSLYARLTFIGLWTLADKEGRLEDRPKRIKAQLLPYDDCDMDAILNELHCANAHFITRYVAQDCTPNAQKCAYIQVRNFTKHQRISGSEAQYDSRIPPPSEDNEIISQCVEKENSGSNLEATWKQPGSTEETHGSAQEAPWIAGIRNKERNKEEERKKNKCANAQNVPDQFERVFWPAYPNKKDKDRARKAWSKINPDEELTGIIVDAIQNQTNEREIRLARNVFCPDWPMPSTWLNNRRWEDEVNLQTSSNPPNHTGGNNGNRKLTGNDYRNRMYAQRATNESKNSPSDPGGTGRLLSGVEYSVERSGDVQDLGVHDQSVRSQVA